MRYAALHRTKRKRAHDNNEYDIPRAGAAAAAAAAAMAATAPTQRAVLRQIVASARLVVTPHSTSFTPRRCG